MEKIEELGGHMLYYCRGYTQGYYFDEIAITSEMIEVHVLGLKFCNGKNHCRKFPTFAKMDNRSRVSSHCIEISSVLRGLNSLRMQH